MANELRNKLIRLAYSNPKLRDDLLPLLTDKVGCGTELEADEKLAKQMHDVKPKGPKYNTKEKVDKPRDPHAKALAQGQFQPKVMNPDKRHKLRDKQKD